MTRKQVFVIAIATQLKDGCGEIVPGYTSGDIRAALMKSLPHYEGISVEERGDLEEWKGGK